jgi:hypothetical protein
VPRIRDQRHRAVDQPRRRLEQDEAGVEHDAGQKCPPEIGRRVAVGAMRVRMAVMIVVVMGGRVHFEYQ